jgi:hypothetical protein
MAAYDLRHYDGVLAFGAVVRDIYLREGWTPRAWTWHEAADVRVFRPLPGRPRDGDLVWVGNWGDDERTAELGEFLVEPVRALGLRARVHGVRYPADGEAGARGRGDRLRRVAPQLRGARALRPLRRHRARPAAAVRARAPRHPHDPRLRGARLRHPARERAVGRRRGPVHARRGLLVARDGAAMRGHLRDVLADASSPPPSPTTGAAPSSPATAALTAWTSSSRSPRSSDAGSAPTPHLTYRNGPGP